jgi:ATP-dependent DNA ligase
MSDKPFLMKGHTFKKHGHKMTYPCWVEVKIDEIRLHAKRVDGAPWVELLSYAGKPLYNLEYFAARIAEWMDNFCIKNLDLGVIVNDNFNDTYRYTRSKNGVPVELTAAHVKFILFDLPDLQGQRFGDRRISRGHVRQDARSWGLSVTEPESLLAHDANEVMHMYTSAREAGHEGIMVKSLDHTYECGKRSYGWLKYKPEEDADGVIVALHEAIAGKDQPELGIKKGDRLGRVGSVTVRVQSEADGGVGSAETSQPAVPGGLCASSDPTVTQATPHGIPHELGRHMLQNPDEYIGQWCEFKYMERDRQGGYRHPTFHRIREAKA